MEASSVLTASPSSSSTTSYYYLNSHPHLSSSFSSSSSKPQFLSSSIHYSSSNSAGKWSKRPESYKNRMVLFPRPISSLIRSSSLAVGQQSTHSLSSSSSSSSSRDVLPKIDKSGRFCSPRAARELALSIIYAACLDGSDPVQLFEKRMNARREPGYEFDKALLAEYNHMSFGGPPVTVETIEEANELLENDEKASKIEAEVLSAPPKLVYSKLILRFTRKLLVAVVESWDTHVVTIDRIAPQDWKNEPGGRILEFSILHLAMSEIAVLGTRQSIVINEAVDLAKRFCDGAAPRVINGCLRTFVTRLS